MRDAGSSCFPTQVPVRFHFSAGHKKNRSCRCSIGLLRKTGLTSRSVPKSDETGRLDQPQATSPLRCFLPLRVSRQSGVAMQRSRGRS